MPHPPPPPKPRRKPTVPAEEEVITISPGPVSPPTEGDFAVMVKQRAVEALASGSLRITAQHGLQAQALLDRRAEKAADRSLALNMARLLSGAISMVPTTVIEGRAVEIHEALAPPEIVAPRDA